MISAEPFLEAALVSLRAHLPAALAAVDALHNDFALEVPRDDGGAIGDDTNDYYLGVVQKPLRYPLVEVAVPDWRMTDFSIGTMTADADFPMMVAITCRDAALHTDRLYRRQLRYVRALLNVLLQPNAFGEHAVVKDCRGAYRQNPEDRKTEAVIGAALVAFSIDTTDSRDI